MQNAAMAALGLNWRYLAFDVEPSRLREAITGAKTMGFVGLNLTVPHKVLALGLVDALDPDAKAWGAVNTIRFKGSPPEVQAHGFNTDGDAIIRALREDLVFEPAGKRVLLLGAGGAGRVAALRLASANVAQLFLMNRTIERAEEIRRDILAHFPKVRIEIGYPVGEVDLIVNATSLGLRPEDELPLDGAKFPLRKAAAVYDMIYRPAETPLLKAAKAAGCRVTNGLGMLLHQGVAALELWSGLKAPITVMRDALVRNVYGS